MDQQRARYDRQWYADEHRRIALEDWVLRQAAREVQSLSFRVQGTGKSGLFAVDRPGQEILPRTAVVVNERYVELRLTVGLPARGRTVLGNKAIQMLCEDLPRLVQRSLPASSFDREKLEERLRLADSQKAIRDYLREKGWIAFVANGSILPRESGVSDRPLSRAGGPFHPADDGGGIEVPTANRSADGDQGRIT